MFKKAYAVLVDSYIDGGAPGHYAIAICETRDTAEQIKEFVNSCFTTMKKREHGTRKYWEASRYIEKFDDHNISLGYHEGYDSKAYIREINIIQPGDYKKMYYMFYEELKKSRKTYEEKHDGKVNYEDWRLY